MAVLYSIVGTVHCTYSIENLGSKQGVVSLYVPRGVKKHLAKRLYGCMGELLHYMVALLHYPAARCSTIKYPVILEVHIQYTS